MFVYYENEKIIGYYSLLMLDHLACELNNLSVQPEYRHNGIGTKLPEHAFMQCKIEKCSVINIGIVEENQVLRSRYESFGFIHTGTKKSTFFRLFADICRNHFNKQGVYLFVFALFTHRYIRFWHKNAHFPDRQMCVF